MSYRNTASFGKRQEYRVIAKLLELNFDVYMTLVDDQGIDCVVRLGPDKYLDIQIKARSKDAKNWSTFAAMKVEARENYYFIFYIEKEQWYFIVPSLNISHLGSMNKSGKNAGKWTIVFPKVKSGAKFKKFNKYFFDDSTGGSGAFRMIK